MTDHAILRVHLTPRGSRNEVCGLRKGVLYVKLTAPPVENAANKALVEFVADLLGVRKSDVEIISGHRSREKTLRVSGVTQAGVAARLGRASRP